MKQRKGVRKGKRSDGTEATQITLESTYYGLFPGSITAGSSTSRLTEIIATGLMYDSVPDLKYCDEIVLSWY